MTLVTHTNRRTRPVPNRARRTSTPKFTTADAVPASDLTLRALYSPEPAAAYLDISRAELYRMIAAGRLLGFRVGRLRRFTRAELDTLATALAEEGAIE